MASVMPRSLSVDPAEPLTEEQIKDRVKRNNIERTSYYSRAKAIQDDGEGELGNNVLHAEGGFFDFAKTSEHSLITTDKRTVITMNNTLDTNALDEDFDLDLGDDLEDDNNVNEKFGYLTTRELHAEGGTLELDVDVVGMQSDKLLVTNEFTGNLKLDIYEINNVNPPEDDYVTGVGLVLARTKGSGTLSAYDREGSLFYHHYDLGSMDSQLQGSNRPSFDTDWYLIRRARLDPELYQTTAVQHTTAMHGATYLSFRNDGDKLLQRLGELRSHEAQDGFWYRTKQGTLSFDGMNNSQNSFHAYELGIDRAFYTLTSEALKMGYKAKDAEESSIDPSLIAKKRVRGISFGYNKGNMSHQYVTTADISNQDPIFGSGTSRGRSISFYQVDSYANGTYIDAIARYSLWDTDMKTPNTRGDIISGKAKERGLTFSVEYGRKHKKEGDWYIEPQAQVLWGRLGHSDYTLSNGTQVNAKGMNTLLTRFGFNLGKEFAGNKGTVYGKLNFFHDFGGKYNATYTAGEDSVNIEQRFNGTWIQYGFGMSYRFNKNVYIYGDMEINRGNNFHSDWIWNAGIRYMY